MVTRGEDFDEFVRGTATRLMRTAVLLTGDRGAAEDLVQDVYERVYVHWRRVRRRRTLAATLALAAFLPAGIIVAVNNQLDRTPQPAEETGIEDPYGRFLTVPTRGDLANDQAYLREAIAAWDASHTTSDNKDRGVFDDLRGEPKAVWAGSTPAGRAAIVVQRAYLRRHDGFNPPGKGEGLSTVIGFVGEDPTGQARVAADGYPAPGGAHPMAFVTSRDGAFWAKPRRNAETQVGALVVLDLGYPMVYTTGRQYAPDGISKRTWTPVAFRSGAAVAELPAGTQLLHVKLARPPANHPRTLQHLVGHPYWTSERPGLWTEADVTDWPLTASSKRDRSLDAFLGAALRHVHDPIDDLGEHKLLRLYGDTPDGSQFLAGLYRIDEDPEHVYGVLRDRNAVRLVHGGIPDVSAPLPVMFRLPNRQGWVVARYRAELEYRVPGDEWRKGTRNAMLVPDVPGAEVRVTINGSETVVPLR